MFSARYLHNPMRFANFAIAMKAAAPRPPPQHL